MILFVLVRCHVINSLEDKYNNPKRNCEKLIINKLPLKLKAADVFRQYGEDNPHFTINYSGFVNNEHSSEIDHLPVISTAANRYSNVGVYPITLVGGADNNYEFYLESAELSILKADQTLQFNNIDDQETDINTFRLSATASSGLEVSFILVEGPGVISGNVLKLTNEGPVIVKAIQEGNNNYLPASEEQTIKGYKVLGINTSNSQNSLIFPNPAKNQINIELPLHLKQASLKMINALGIVVLEQQLSSITEIYIGNFPRGVYQLELQMNHTRYTKQLILH